MRKKILYVLLLVLIFSLNILPRTPKAGLGGIAASPDGKRLAVGGINRVIYIVDAKTLAVKDRVWLKTQIYDLAFNKDGSILIAEDTKETLHFINTKSLKVINQVSKAADMNTAPGVNKLAALERGYRQSVVKLYSMSDGKLLQSIVLEGRVLAHGIDAEAKRLVVILQGPKDKEAKVPHKQIPKNLKGVEKDLFVQKNDGKVSILVEYDLSKAVKTAETEIFYHPGQFPKVVVLNEVTLVVNYNNVNARISADNTVTLFKLQNLYNYGIGVSADRSLVASGGLRTGSIYNTQTGDIKAFKIDPLPGWPEYLKGFAFGSDGAVFAGTMGFRLVKIGPGSVSTQAVPVY